MPKLILLTFFSVIGLLLSLSSCNRPARGPINSACSPGQKIENGKCVSKAAAESDGNGKSDGGEGVCSEANPSACKSGELGSGGSLSCRDDELISIRNCSCDAGRSMSDSGYCEGEPVSSASLNCESTLPDSKNINGTCRCIHPAQHWKPVAGSIYTERCYDPDYWSDELEEIQAEGGTQPTEPYIEGSDGFTTGNTNTGTVNQITCVSENGSFYNDRCYCGGFPNSPFDPDTMTCDGIGNVTPKT